MNVCRKYDAELASGIGGQQRTRNQRDGNKRPDSSGRGERYRAFELRQLRPSGGSRYLQYSADYLFSIGIGQRFCTLIEPYPCILFRRRRRLLLWIVS